MSTPVDVVVGGPMAEIPELAHRAAVAGADGVWVHEASSDGLVQATLAAGATDGVLVGTDVAVAFARSPTIAAMAALDLDALTGGRFVLGLGSQVRRIVEERFSAEFSPPAARMAEYLRAVRAVWETAAGEHTTFEGDYFRVTMPGAYRSGDPVASIPRLHLAAVGPLMTKVATRHADGLMGHPFTSAAYLEQRMIPRIESGLREAGRSRADFSLCVGLIVSVDEDREAARRRAATQVGFYGTTPNYRDVFEVGGHGWLTDRLRDAFRSGGPDALAAVIPDEVLDEHAIACTPDELGPRLTPYRELADRLVLTPPAAAAQPDEHARGVRALTAALTDLATME